MKRLAPPLPFRTTGLLFIGILCIFLWLQAGSASAQVIQRPTKLQHCSVCSRTFQNLYQLPDKRVLCREHMLAIAQPCSSCGKIFHFKNFNQIQYREKSHTWVCIDCQHRQERCALCGTPVGKNNLGIRLTDSRIFCKKDSQNSVFDTGKVQQMFMKGKQILIQEVGPIMSLPIRTTQVTLVDIPEMNQKLHLQTDDFSYTYGLTQTTTGAEPNLSETKICIHSGLPYDRVQETCIHEYAHAWLGAYGHRKLRLSRLAQEGFAEWVTQKALKASDQEWIAKLQHKPKVYYQGWLYYKQLEKTMSTQEILRRLKKAELLTP